MDLVEVDPLQILFSQCCVRPKFKNGLLVEDTIKKLVSGVVSPNEIELIRVCTLSNGKTHSLDNRRLYAFKEAIKRGCNFKTVIVIKTSNLYDLKSLQWKMTHPPSKNWSVVKVKKDCKPINPENILSTRTSNLFENTTTPYLYKNSSYTRSSLYGIRSNLCEDNSYTKSQEKSSVYGKRSDVNEDKQERSSI
ncbi:hypothetical protein C1646_705626 [Rhizophagus diaphanus]|nr:hypothetical protein C1646_705626 [Rhizophagus diaphanus] [Rhizophagus sp. MUCL 43196]